MTTALAALSKHSIGLYLQIAGAGAFLAGVALSMEHIAIGACFLAGAAGFFIGKKIRTT